MMHSIRYHLLASQSSGRWLGSGQSAHPSRVYAMTDAEGEPYAALRVNNIALFNKALFGSTALTPSPLYARYAPLHFGQAVFQLPGAEVCLLQEGQSLRQWRQDLEAQYQSAGFGHARAMMEARRHVLKTLAQDWGRDSMRHMLRSLAWLETKGDWPDVIGDNLLWDAKPGHLTWVDVGQDPRSGNGRLNNSAFGVSMAILNQCRVEGHGIFEDPLATESYYALLERLDTEARSLGVWAQAKADATLSPKGESWRRKAEARSVPSFMPLSLEENATLLYGAMVQARRACYGSDGRIP